MRTTLTLLLTLLLSSAPVAAGAPQGDRAEALLGLARTKRDGGDPAGARRYFEEARRARPFTVAELAEFFWLLAGQDAAAALDLGREVLAATPANRDVRDRSITEALALKDESTVAELAREGQRVDPATARWPRRLAESYLRRRQPARAADAYLEALRLQDATTDDRAGRALALEAAALHADSLKAWAEVPTASRISRPDWERSRLRALARAGDLGLAARELEAWLARHPADREMRELSVDVWTRAGRPAMALEAMELSPTSSTSPDDWLRRRATLARDAGARDVAIASLSALVARPSAAARDRDLLAEWLLEDGQFDRAATLIGDLSVASPCSDRALAFIDRLPSEKGTPVLLRALSDNGCQAAPAWVERGVERAAALGQHAQALALFDRLPSDSRRRPEMLRLEGQLRTWTGDTSAAIRLLEQVLRSAPDDRAAREALVDAYRAEHRPSEAWRVAKPLIEAGELPSARRLTYAALALEADRAADVPRLLENLEAPDRSAGAALLGRALLATGRPTEARDLLATVPPAVMSPATALALVDAVLAVSGLEAAARTAERFQDDTAEWRDLLGRRLMLATLTGHSAEAAAVRSALARVDPHAAIIAEAEAALAMHQPHAAIALLGKLPNDPQSERAADLEATARAAVGDWTTALEIIGRLRARRPESPSLLIRETEWRHLVASTAASLGAVAALPSQLPGNLDALTAAVRALARAGQHDQALTALGPSSSWAALPLATRILAARSLQATGRAREALALIPEEAATDLSTALLRAELIGIVEGPDRAAVVYARLARTMSTGTSQVYLKWAEIAPTEAARADILTEALLRFPADAALAGRLAAAAQAAGQTARAWDAARSAVRLDPRAPEHWFRLIDVAAAGSPEQLEQAIRQFETAGATQPSVAIGMAERVSAFVRRRDDPLVARLLGWLNEPQADSGLAVSQSLARARVLATAERWDESLAEVADALDREADSPRALKLRAELLSWSGRHAEAIDAYDTYLARQSQDLEARRQQARVAGWAGQFSQALRLYAEVARRAPADARVAAERDAKRAFFAGKWDAAIEAYDRWVAAEPDNGEARFERAEALRAAGRVADANAALDALATTTDHRLARAALDRAIDLREPAVGLISDRKTSDGYAGQRLLELDQYGGVLRFTAGAAGRVTAEVEGAGMRAVADGSVRQGARAGITARLTATPRLRLEARAAGWSLAPAGGPQADLGINAAWRPTARWTLGAGAGTQPFVENLATIDRRLSARGVFAGVGFESPHQTLDVRIARDRVSDGNVRARMTITATQALGDRLRHVRVIGWADTVAFRARAAQYYSPSRHGRADVGLEYAHEFSTPRFRGDRQHVLAGSYLIGVDDRGATYHHPMLRLALEFSSGTALDARAGWIRSDVYREVSAFVGLTLRPGRRARK